MHEDVRQEPMQPASTFRFSFRTVHMEEVDRKAVIQGASWAQAAKSI